jgi:hypothetical protein
MRSIAVRTSLVWIALAGVLALPQAARAQDTHTITVQGIAWKYNGKLSSAASPIMVDDLKIGDLVEITIPGGIPHGFVTITRKTPPPSDKFLDAVLACGETPASKPKAVLKEVCAAGAASHFNKIFVGTLKLEVMNTFTTPVDFYCVQHKDGMPGILKLK